MEVLDSFEFDKNHVGASKHAKYLDGRIYKVKLGVDVPKSFRTGILVAARRKGLKVRTQTVDDGKALVIQAFDPNEETQ
jgi:hypothetical protein